MKTATFESQKLTVLAENLDGTVDLGHPAEPASIGPGGRFVQGVVPVRVVVAKCPVSSAQKPGHCVLDVDATAAAADVAAPA